MRLITFQQAGGEARLGAFLTAGHQEAIDLALAAEVVFGKAQPAFESMLSLIEGGAAAWKVASSLIERAPDEAILPTGSIRLLAPLPRPPRLRDFSAFETHASASTDVHVPDVWYRWPVYYKGNPYAVTGPETEVQWPAESNQIDFELELAAVIGRAGKGVKASDASGFLFGFTIFNDLTARDWQFQEIQVPLGPSRSKDFDGANVLGPCIVTADEIGDPYSLTMVARINGVEWSRGTSATLYHRFEDMISFVSEAETLVPGEIFGSGTVGGGCGYELGRYLKRGDLIELEITGIGVLATRVV
jgi:2-keto-4-pentenoate hydratase/2-oxohepta-3-ene-1,7-dioic acid hydratase in catechol pathway